MEWFSATLIPVHEANQKRDLADASMETLHHLEILWNKLGFENEVLWRIPGYGKLGSDDQFSTSDGKALIGARNFIKIASQIPHRRIDLSETDPHARSRRLCASGQRAIPFRELLA